MENRITIMIEFLLAFCIYSCVGVFSKFASSFLFLSWNYLFFFSVTLLLLGVYSVLWQMILSKTELHKAYLYKSSTIIITMIVSYSLFGERISEKNVIGVLLIVIGLFAMSGRKC